MEKLPRLPCPTVRQPAVVRSWGRDARRGVACLSDDEALFLCGRSIVCQNVRAEEKRKRRVFHAGRRVITAWSLSCSRTLVAAGLRRSVSGDEAQLQLCVLEAGSAGGVVACATLDFPAATPQTSIVSVRFDAQSTAVACYVDAPVRSIAVLKARHGTARLASCQPAPPPGARRRFALRT